MTNTPTPHPSARIYWRTARIRVRDLRCGDVALLGRHHDDTKWRDVLAVYTHECDPNEDYDHDSGEWHTLRRKVVHGYDRIGVRLLLDEDSTRNEIRHRLLILRALDLVEIQVPDGGRRTDPTSPAVVEQQDHTIGQPLDVPQTP